MTDNSSFSGPVIISTSTLEMRMGQDGIENLRKRLAQFISIAGSGMFDLQVQNADFIKALSVSQLVDDTRKYIRAVVQHYAEKEEIQKLLHNLAVAIERKETTEEKQDIALAFRFIFDLLNDYKNKTRVLEIMTWFSKELLNSVKMDSANTIAAIYRYFYTVQLNDSKWRENLEGIFDVGDYLCCGVPIGKGSYGKVLKGFHKETGGIVAVKQIDLFDKSPKVIEALNREGKMLKYMNHPNIIRLYDAVKDHRRMYFVMEYCPLGDLDEWIKDQYATNQTIPLASIVNLMKEITNALKFLRGQSIVHRDLKPQNILLSQENGNLQAKLIDFTSAREVNEGQMLKSIWGTPLYMAPEVLSGKPYSEKADLWSLGVILYKMLFAALPFNGVSPPDLVKNIHTKKLYIPPNQLPQEVLSLLESLLQVDYQKRISWADFFCHPFFSCAEKSKNNTPRSKDQIEALLSENHELEMLLSKYKETATNYEEMITKIKLEAFNLQAGNAELKEKIEVHQSNEKKYQQDREQLLSRIEQLEKDNAELMQKNVTHKADDDLVKLLEKDLRNKTKQYEEEKQLMTQSHNAIFVKLKEELESTKKENEILKNQEKDNRGLNDIIEALSTELAAVENTLTGLYTERDLFMKEKLDLEAANIALKADLQRYIKKAHEGDSTQKTRQLEDQISSLQSEIKRLNSIIDSVGVKLADALKEQSRLEDELAAAVIRGKDKERLELANDELTHQVDKLSAEKKQLGEELKNTQNNLDEILSSFTQNNH